MDDAAIVRGFERLSDLARDGQCLVERHRASRKAHRELLTLHELHRQRTHSIGGFEAEDLRDVCVIECGEGPRFPLEAGEPIGISWEAIRKHFDRDVAAQVLVAGSIDLSHSTRAEWTEDFVGSEATAGRQAHCWSCEMRGYDTARTTQNSRRGAMKKLSR